ncbi:MAG: hypothetical protein P857_690 [Candidatus Xenolissoclinum pacificiensis L6]|uniref:Motility protein B-like N-terminal domain-containing protein n=1 Tax=Candidatus Xenolissoclinum pacificiensis L6 TaxID=1401685 RepID=W2UZD5_9RICK|nr:MAG: hypothetical protein P857_690 [Candidatus Xenolissoclinum pacificiensis L6]
MGKRGKKDKVSNSAGEVIVRRTKKTGHKHHGGMWKVAYADFVTAMMVFFLVMWIISIIPKEDIEQVVEYFSTNRSKVPTYASPQDISLTESRSESVTIQTDKNLNKLREAFNRTNFSENILVRISKEGYLILSFQVSDRNNIFQTDGTELSQFGQDALSYTAKLINALDNYSIVVSVNYPLFTSGFVETHTDLEKWRFVVDRASNVSNHMMKYGLPSNKITAVESLFVQNYQYSGFNTYKNIILQIILMTQSQNREFLESRF